MEDEFEEELRDDEELDDEELAKALKVSTSTTEQNTNELEIIDVQKQMASDEELAKYFQENDDGQDQKTSELDNIDAVKVHSAVFANLPDGIKFLKTKIDKEGHFFLATRRSAPFSRCLALWQREAKKTSPEKTFTVRFCGEEGIDDGAIAREFL